MSQRGGSVSSDVRFGAEVLSPMVPAGEADFLVVLSPDQVDPNRHVLREGGTLIAPDQVDADRLANRKSLNVALLGRLSRDLPIPVDHWQAALRANLAEKLHDANLQAFEIGRARSAGA
jgi:indolepyruvate ferredoxin oxidoreductase beta subunit